MEFPWLTKQVSLENISANICSKQALLRDRRLFKQTTTLKITASDEMHRRSLVVDSKRCFYTVTAWESSVTHRCKWTPGRQWHNQRFEPGGSKFSWRGPTGHRRGATDQHSKKVKKWQWIWMLWISILSKKTKTPLETQKSNNLQNTKYQNVNSRGPSFCIYLSRGAARLPPVSYATADMVNIQSLVTCFQW